MHEVAITFLGFVIRRPTARSISRFIVYLPASRSLSRKINTPAVELISVLQRIS